ncbi:hypothetical protein GLOIN_2v1882271 [Rhizophagus irregularis DAOM 181602=DAOM 197198]|nr:hypothetical protein GLOIN_2v1882271 [Rhizophagus irregularis DAOM 181602=DAOM 197198]
MDKESDSTFEIDNSSSPEFFDDEYKDIEEIKLYIIVDKRGKKSSSKALVIKPVEYTNVMEKINAVVQKAFQNENIKLSDYSMSYKAMNARSPSSELEDKCDFDEFIEDYKKVIAANKKMAVMIELEDSTNEKVKKTEKRSKKKSRILREDDLSKEEKTRAEVISALNTASVSDLVLTTNLGIQFECYYIGKDKPTEIPITLFHPNESCLKSQTTVLKRGSSIFFSGALTSTEEMTEEIQEREEQEESASILITPATTPATTPPSKKRVGHAKV